MFSNYFSFERSGLATIFHYFTRPKFIVENYCKGNKGVFFSPGRLLIFSIIIFALHVAFVRKEILGVSFSFGDLKSEYGYWLFILTLVTLTSQLTFIRNGLYLSKNIVSVTYACTTFFIVLTILSDILFYFIGDFIDGQLILIYLIFVFTWNSIALTKKRKVWMFALNTLFQILTFSIIMYGMIALLSAES